MGDPFGREKPVKPTGTRSRASKTKRASRVKEADRRAKDRYLVASRGKALHDADEGLSFRSSYALVKQQRADGAFEVSSFPGFSTYFRLVKEAMSGDGPPTVTQFKDKPRSGRPVLEWHPDVVEHFEDLLLSQIHTSVVALHEDLRKWAEARDLAAPTDYMVRARVEGTDLAELSAARHGRKAARADATGKLTIPTDYPHHVWTLDELDAENWIKATHPVTRKLVSVRPKVILIVENHSRPILNVYACQPFKNGGITIGFDTEDVLGCFFGAVFRELAAEPFKPYVGYMPWIVRQDGAKQHDALKHLLRKQNPDAGPDMEKGAPWSRGNVEALVGRFKDLCTSIRCHTGTTLPADRVKEHQNKARTDAAATTSRVRRKAIVAVEDLLTIEEYQEELNRVAGEYLLRQHRMLGMSPEASYHNLLRPKALRPAIDALSMLEPVVLTVGKTGIEHRNKKFVADANGSPIPIGAQVLCRPDPLRRGLFAEYQGGIYFLPEVGDFSRTVHPPSVVKEQKARTAEHSEAAAAALTRHVQEMLGPGKRVKQMETALPRDVAAEDVAVAAPEPARTRASRSNPAKGAAAATPAAPTPPPAPAASEPVSPPTRPSTEPEPAALPAAVPEQPARRPRGIAPPVNPKLWIVR